MSIDVRVRRITYRAEGIHSFELVPVGGTTLPLFTAGAHIQVQLPNGMSRPYSLHNLPGEIGRYEIAVQCEPNGRGGSRYLHEHVRPGDVLAVSEPVNHFELDESASRYILIGGGIGVTPLIAMVRRLRQIGADYAFHYCSRTEDLMAFREEAEDLCPGGRLSAHIDGGDPTKGLDCARLLATPEAGTLVYCCGPAGLMSAVRAASARWPAGTVHFESFGPPAAPATMVSEAGAEFEVELASRGLVVPVRPGESILEALRARGIDPDSSCEAGTCGVCRTRILGGEAEHLDYVLAEDEQADWMMICVSRAKSRRLQLEL